MSSSMADTSAKTAIIGEIANVRKSQDSTFEFERAHVNHPRARGTIGMDSHSKFAFSLIDDVVALDGLKDEWNDLFERAGRANQVFQTFSWCKNWCDVYLDDDRRGTLAILVGRENGRLALIWPLLKVRKMGLTKLIWLGDPVTQYGDVLVDAPTSGQVQNVLDLAWRYLEERSGADFLYLRKVRRDSPLVEFLKSVRARPCTSEKAPFMDLASAQNFEEYTKRYSSRARRNRRRLERRLKERGNIEVRRIAAGPHAREVASRAIDLKKKWLESRGLVSAAISDPRTRTFFANFAEHGDETGCVLNAVYCDEEVVAVEISIHCKGSNFLHVTVFDLNFEKVGVGAFLLENNLRQAYDDGVLVYDFLAPSDRYKVEWCDESVEVNDWSVGLSKLGSLWARTYLGLLRPQLKRCWHTLPTVLRQNLKGNLNL